MTLTQVFVLLVFCFAVPIAMALLWIARAILRAVSAWSLMRRIELEHQRMTEVRGRRVS